MNETFQGAAGEELEVLEELEPIEDSSAPRPRPEPRNLEAPTEGLPKPSLRARGGAKATLFLADAGARSLLRSYEQIPQPMAIMDESLEFIFGNRPFKELLKAFDYPESSSLFGTFSRAIPPEAAESIYEALRSEEKGYAWKGTISHKAKDAAAVITKVHIFPFFAEKRLGSGGLMARASRGRPQAYSVYLDDVTDENRKVLKDMFSSLLEASKLKDNDTGKHIERVNYYASLLAKAMFNDPRWPEVDKDFIEDIGFLAAMHDVGKIGTPDNILNKEGPLSEFEWGIMKEHTINGAFILSSYPNPMAKVIARSHHEWWNGSGYPFNLVGTDIPLAARIVTLADVYDALRMKRSYKPAYSHGIAMQKIEQEREIHFDPAIADLALGIHEGFARIFTENAD